MGLWKSFHLILMYFFFHNFSMLWGEAASNSVDFQKLIFFYNFDRLSLFFDQSKLQLKILVESFSVLIERNCFSINWISWIRFFKIQCLTHSKHFFKSFFNFSLSLRLGKAKSSNFCHFPLNLLQGFPLPKPVSPFYPSFCILFHDFIHKLMHFNEIFGTFHIWDFCWINPLFLKLIIGFCSYIVIFMIYVG